MKKSIPPKLEPEILKQVAEGLSYPEITARLAEQGIKTSKTAVQRIVARNTKERGELTKSAVQQKLVKTVTTDLDAVEQMLDRAAKLGERLGGKNLEPQIAFLEQVLESKVTDLYDTETGQLLAFDKMPPALSAVVKKFKFTPGEPTEVEGYDKLRAVEIYDRIRREAADERARLLELRLKLAGAGTGDAEEADAIRSEIDAALAEAEG